jgi:hypothetical protein
MDEPQLSSARLSVENLLLETLAILRRSQNFLEQLHAEGVAELHFSLYAREDFRLELSEESLGLAGGLGLAVALDVHPTRARPSPDGRCDTKVKPTRQLWGTVSDPGECESVTNFFLPPEKAVQMRKNYHQVRKQRELAKKLRQQEKQQRRAARVSTPAPTSASAALEGDPVATSDAIAHGAS